MADDRTEQPTARRLEEARKRGQVVRTREAGQAASLVAATLALGWLGTSIMEHLASYVTRGVERVAFAAHGSIAPGEIRTLAVEGLAALGLTVGPIAITSIVTVMALHGAQGGWVFASEALHLNWSRLNPATGIKRFGFSVGGTELLRTVIAVAMITFLAWRLIVAFLAGSLDLARVAPADAAMAMWAASATLIKQAAIGLLLIAGADYFVQRRQLHQSLRMTKQEIKDEHRLLEGNPEIKARVRRIQRDMTRRRMLRATRHAKVVITNPTHFAVALDYQRGMAAPVVVAKGQDYLAQRMKAIAAAHDVPMVENVALARTLYSSVDVGETIPGPLFEAVAEVLAYLIRIKRLVL
jgi:flagellar biosynthetic protein FlhB